jgi:O-antigen/teichoic acid export membrane protein
VNDKPSVGTETKLLAKHSLIYGLGNLLNGIAAYLLLPVYTRFLTPHDYGIKELVGLTTEITGILMATAISSAVYRFYFEYENEKDQAEVISSAIIAVGGIGIVCLIGLFSVSRYLAGVILDSPELFHFFMISFCSMWFHSVNNIGYNYLRAQQHSLKVISFSFGNLVLAIILNIYFICFLKIGVLGVFLSTLITSIVLTFVLTVPILHKVGLSFSREKIIEMIKFGLPMIPSQMGAFVVHLSDRFFIKHYCSIADAGLYSLGYRFGAIPANFISSPFNQTWMPRRFELSKQEGAEKVFGRIFTYFLLLMFWACLGVSILTKEMLEIIAEPSYWSASAVVPIIALGTTIFTFHYHFNIGILIKKKTKYLAYINTSNAVIVTALNFILIPTYGIYGAAVATIIAFSYKAAITYWLGSKYYRIHFEFGRITHLFITAAVLFTLSNVIPFDHLAARVIIKSILLVSYPVILFLTGFFNDAEQQKIKSAISSNSAFFTNRLKS